MTVFNQNMDSFGAVIEQEPVVFSFDAPGWYVLLGLVAFIIFGLRMRHLILYRRNAYRRQAVSQIQTLAKEGNSVELIKRINLTLKEIVLRSNPRSTISPLEGSTWIDFLNSKCHDGPFESTDYKLFEDAVYREMVDNNQAVEGLMNRSLIWINKHKLR